MEHNTISNKCHSEAECSSCTHTSNPLLVGINVEHRSHLDDHRTTTHFKAGELLYREGMYPSGLICLNKGKVMVTKKDAYDNRVVLNLQKEVSFVGIADFMSGKPYQSDCYALEDSRVCMIQREQVLKMMNENKFFVKNIIEEISDQYHQSNERLLSLTKKHMPSRIADALCTLHETFGMKKDGCTLNVYMKRKDLAILSNMNVANVIRHLSTFNDEGIVALNNKDIIIKDLPKLLKIRVTS